MTARPASMPVKSRSLATSSASNLLLFFVNVVVTYFLSPVLVRTLGNAGYGLWEIVLSFAGYLGVMDLGVGPAIVRYVARLKAENNEEALQGVTSSGLVALSVAGLLALLLMSGLAFFPHIAIGARNDVGSHWFVAALCIGGTLCVQFPGSLFSAYLMGQQKYLVINIWRVILTLSRLAILIHGLKRGYLDPLVWLSLVTFLMTVVEYAVLALIAMRSAHSAMFRRASVSRDSLRELMTFGLNSSLLMAASRLQFMTVPILISHVLGTGMVVFFAIPNRLAAYANGIGIALCSPIMPYFSAKSREPLEQNQAAWVSATRVIQILSLMMPVALLAVGPAFIRIWMGAEYATAAATILPFLCLAQFIEGLAPHSVTYLVGHAKHGRLFRFNLIAAAAGVLLTILLMREGGLVGAAISALAYTLATRAYAARKACQELSLSIFAHFRLTVFRHVPAIAVFALVLFGVRALRPLNAYATIIALLTVSVSLYGICVWRLSLTKDERTQVMSLLRRRRTVG
jgi:O-antigen/teichoic acid export membrane protein